MAVSFGVPLYRKMNVWALNTVEPISLNKYLNKILNVFKSMDTLNAPVLKKMNEIRHFFPWIHTLYLDPSIKFTHRFDVVLILYLGPNFANPIR